MQGEPRRGTVSRGGASSSSHQAVLTRQVLLEACDIFFHKHCSTTVHAQKKTFVWRCRVQTLRSGDNWTRDTCQQLQFSFPVRFSDWATQSGQTVPQQLARSQQVTTSMCSQMRMHTLKLSKFCYIIRQQRRRRGQGDEWT